MRKIRRLPLPARATRYLQRKQAEIDASSAGAPEIAAIWKNARQTKAIGEVVLGKLRLMARERQRCMYCEDSRGTDIDHFRPKAEPEYRAFVFAWPNMLLNCTDCGRRKLDRFPVDASGAPLLIDPTSDDPWDHLFFEPVTGQIAPRYRPDHTRDPKGQTTLEILAVGDHEAITTGRTRCRRNLEGAVHRFLRNARDASAPDARDRAVKTLLQEIRDNDEYGLGQWYFLREGSHAPPFSELQADFSDVWGKITALVAR